MLGYVAAVVASLAWSLNPAVISRFRGYIRPLTFTAFRALTALAVLYPIARLRYSEPYNSSLYALAIIVVSAVLGPGMGDALYTKSIQLLGGSLAVILSYTYILISQLLAVLLLNERVTLSLAIGTLLAFSGVVVALSPWTSRGGMSLKGVTCALGAATLWGVATILVRLALSFTDPLALTVIRLVAIALLFLPLGLTFEGPPLRSSIQPILLASTITGVIGWGLGMYLFILSIDLIGVSATTVVTALTPVISQLSTTVIAGEKVRANSILGAVLTFLGVAITTLQPNYSLPRFR